MQEDIAHDKCLELRALIDAVNTKLSELDDMGIDYKVGLCIGDNITSNILGVPCSLSVISLQKTLEY